MKKPLATTLLVLVFFFCHTSAHADALTQGKKRARQEDKPVVAYFFSQHCVYCEQMQKNVLNDRTIADSLKNDTVYVPVDVDKQETTALAYRVRGTPTTLVLESTGKRIVEIPGYMSKDDFKMLLAYVKGRHYKMMGFGEFLRSARAASGR